MGRKADKGATESVEKGQVCAKSGQEMKRNGKQ